MVWTNPKKFLREVLTHTDLNALLRDDMLETAPAKATAAGRLFGAVDDNEIAEREIASASPVAFAFETTTSTTYTDLATLGPAVTVTTAGRALVMLTASVRTTLGDTAYASYAVSGATVTAAIDDRALQWRAQAASRTVTCFFLQEAVLLPGTNTFTMKYRTSAGTASFAGQRITVIPL